MDSVPKKSIPRKRPVDKSKRLEAINKQNAIKAAGEPIDPDAAYALMLRSSGLDPADPAQLPLFPEDTRAQPNDTARAAIFVVAKRGTERKALSDQPIFAIGEDLSIKMTGVELRAEDDELVWLQILNYASRLSSLDTWIEQTYYRICADIGWPANGQYYDRLHKSLLRLATTGLTVHSKRIAFGTLVRMIDKYEWQDAQGKKLPAARVKLDRRMQLLFGRDAYTLANWERYRKLKPMARRIADWALSHDQPFDVKPETIQALTGSHVATKKKLRQQIREACDELVEAEMLRSYTLGDLLHLERTPALTFQVPSKKVKS